MNSPWHFGNTTVRNPLRIKRGLSVLYNSPFNGNLTGRDKEILFADELERNNVIEIKNKNQDYSSFGRKWRACFSQLGFITHKFSREMNNVPDTVITKLVKDKKIQLTGYPYEITPNGLRLINATTYQEQQECMLRALLAYQIPSIIEPRNGEQPFIPFIFILQVLYELRKLENSLGLSKAEMSILQIHRDHNSVDKVVKEILCFRESYLAATGKGAKHKIERNLLKQIAQSVGLQTDSMSDYADVNFRYPRLTGLVSHQGRRLILNENKMPIIELLLENGPSLIKVDDSEKYLLRLWNGAELPTDDEIGVRSEINRYVQLLRDTEIKYIPTIPTDASIADLNMIRYKLEEQYYECLEKNFAREQSETNKVQEIIAYLKLLNKQTINEEYDLEIDDEPAYLEWTVWRAFLAIDSLMNEPYEARRFKIDQDFFPIGCAPGGGPDLIFEFNSYLLVVEVTLTSSSRQEAAEGEPVRRHIAVEKRKMASVSDKPVYGLFIARSIDNNTAETFRIGVWYNGDEPDFINVVPITLSQFINIMNRFLNDKFDNTIFRQMLDSCLIPRNAHAPAWKKEIEKVVTNFCII